MKLFKIIKILFGALKLSLFREKLGTSNIEQYLAKYNIAYTIDWIGFILLIIFTSIISTGVSAESHILFKNTPTMNVFILSTFIFFSVIAFSLLIKRLIIPNLSILIDRIPIPPYKTFIIKLIIESFDYKIVILISQFMLIPVFNYYYGLSNSVEDLIIIYVIVLNVYFLACQVSLFIKRIAYSRFAKLTFNKIRLIIVIIAIPIYIVSKTVHIKFDISLSLLGFMLIMLTLNFLFFIFLRHLELSK